MRSRSASHLATSGVPARPSTRPLMTLGDLALLSRRGRLRVAVLIFVLIVGAVWASAHYLEPAPPSHIVLASGLEDGLPHQYAQRYIEILRRAGVTVEERMTSGAGENLQLL